jgi:hypothetical protein
MNIDYTNHWEVQNLFSLAIQNPNNFSPNPFVQFVSKYITWFKKVLLKNENDIQGLQKNVNPRHNKMNEQKLLWIEEYFNRLWLDSKKRILNIRKASSEEVLYVSRDSLHSMRKIAHFIDWEKYIEIIEVPFVDWEQILSKKWNDLLHMFRFMFIS